LTNINLVEDNFYGQLNINNFIFFMPTFWIHEPHPLKVSLLPTCFFIKSHLIIKTFFFFSIFSINMALKKKIPIQPHSKWAMPMVLLKATPPKMHNSN
jgi:hypothetical protein